MIQHAGDIGDRAASAVVDFKFTSTDDTTSGQPTALAGGALSVYKDNSTVQSTAGVTLTADFDSITGLNHVRITTATDGSFYSAGSEFCIILSTGSVGGVDHTGYVIGSFSIANRPLQSIGASVITAASIATGAIDADAIAADAIGASELAADAVTEIADGILKRDMSAVTGESARSLLNALRFLRNKWSISGSTLTVTKEDDSTSAWTAALTTSGSADPVTGSDPS